MATTTARVTPGKHNPSISAQTVRNRLREVGLRACRPVVRQVHTRHHPQHRLWAQTHSQWIRQDWQKVLVTDRLRFCLTRGDGLIRVYHRRNESYTKACTLERDRFGGGGSVMVWGNVSQHHWTELVVIAGNLNAVHYREDVPLPHVVPFLQAHPDMILSMTMPSAILLVLCVISCKTGMSLFCHGQRRARISIPLSTSVTCWIGG